METLAATFNGNKLTTAIGQMESGGQDYTNGHLTTSPKGAQAAMQVMPGTATNPGFGVRPAANNSPAELDRVGSDYAMALHQHYGGDIAKALAAYNWGPGHVDRAIAAHGPNWQHAAPAETQNYIANGLRRLGG